MFERQETVETDDHAVVRQVAASASDTDAVRVYKPKLSPLIVTDDAPETTVFARLNSDRTGESKLSAPTRVPILAPTVRTGDLLKLEAALSCRSDAPHVITVPVVHAVVEHNCASSAIPALGVRSVRPNSSPRNVRVAVDVAAIFILDRLEYTGALYENRFNRVPTTAATVTAGLAFVDARAGEAHVSLVLVTQLDDWQVIAPIWTVTLKSVPAKLVPYTLRVCAPLLGELPLILEIAGASNVNSIMCVPTTALIVTEIVLPVAYDLPWRLHWRLVPDTQEDVLHGVDESMIEGEVSYFEPNEKPEMVTLAPPDVAPLNGSSNETTGASNVN